MDDFLLILKMKQGNEDAFEKFVRKYYSQILQYCRYHCFDMEHAEDLTQETFLKFIGSLQSYHHMGKAQNYLYTIAGNLCKNNAKKKKEILVEQDKLEQQIGFRDVMEGIETKICIEQALDKLLPELRMYKNQTTVVAKEEKLLETSRKSKEIFLLCEQQHSIHYFEFLIAQFRLIRKRWWILQTLMLGIVFVILPNMQDKASMLRILGVIGVLFVVLIIPEFWKNKSYDCMQIEGSCLYSLRQIYTARMIWFGMVDMFILTCFCMTIRGKLGLATVELFVQFLFPLLVAACICFGTLCSKTLENEGTAILFCLLWNAVWCFIILNETVYKAISFPIWCALFVFFSAFLAGAIYKTIYDCNKYWEVDLGGITNG